MTDIRDEFDPPLKQRQMGLRVGKQAAMNELAETSGAELITRDNLDTRGVTVIGPFDTMDLADVDDLPVCCICGKTITGMPVHAWLTKGENVWVDYWYCVKAPNCKTGQGELGI